MTVAHTEDVGLQQARGKGWTEVVMWRAVRALEAATGQRPASLGELGKARAGWASWQTRFQGQG